MRANLSIVNCADDYEGKVLCCSSYTRMHPYRSRKRGFQFICGVDTCCGERSCVLQLMLKVNCFCPFFQESPSPWSPWYPNKDVFQTSSMCTMYSVGYYCRLWTFYIACKAGHCYQSAILEAWNENLWQQWQWQRKRCYWLFIKENNEESSQSLPKTE